MLTAVAARHAVVSTGGGRLNPQALERTRFDRPPSNDGTMSGGWTDTCTAAIEIWGRRPDALASFCGLGICK